MRASSVDAGAALRCREKPGGDGRRPAACATKSAAARLGVSDREPHVGDPLAEQERAAVTLSITARASARPMRYVCTPGVPNPG